MLWLFSLSFSILTIDERPPIVTIGGVLDITPTESGKIQIFSTMIQLIISEGVQTIGDFAFTKAGLLQNVTLPTSLTKIGRSAFQYCPNLNIIPFKKNLQHIGYACFEGSPLSQEVVAPETMTEFESYSFTHTGIQRLTFKNTQTCVVRSNAFANIPDIVVDFGVSPVTLESNAFIGAFFSSVTVGINVILQGNPFSSFLLETINVAVGHATYSINNNALIDAAAKTLVVFPAKRTGNYIIPSIINTIGIGAFSRTNLTSIDCSRIVRLDFYAFELSQASLTKLTFPVMEIVDQYAFINSQIREVYFGNVIREILYLAFSNCRNLIAINLPNSITKIGDGILSGCSSLLSVTVADDHPFVMKDNQNILYTKDYKNFIFIPKDITSINVLEATSLSPNGFADLQKLKSVTFEGPITYFPSNLFDHCIGLETFTVPASVDFIGSYSFFNCTNLHTVNFLGSRVTFGIHSFRHCVKLTTINFPDASSFDEQSFLGCNSLVHISFPLGTIKLARSSFGICVNLETVTIKCTEVTITDPFLKCPKLYKITIDTKTITDFAFKELPALKTVVLGPNIESIGLSAFLNSKLLETVEWESLSTSKLKNIGNNAFSNCDSLVTISLPKLVTDITASIFSGSKHLISILVEPNLFKSVEGIVYNTGETILCVCPAGLRTIRTLNNTDTLGRYAFAGCLLEEISLSSKLTKINDFCFLDCKYLQSVNIPLNIEYIGETPFRGCESLKTIFYCGTSDSGMRTFDSKDPFPKNVIIWVSTEYLENSFMKHEVQKSSSTSPDKCPLVPTVVFSMKKRASKTLIPLIYSILTISLLLK